MVVEGVYGPIYVIHRRLIQRVDLKEPLSMWPVRKGASIN